MSNILRGQDSIDIIKPITEPYEDDYVNNDTQEISEINKQEEQENHNEFEIKRGAEAIALVGMIGVTAEEVEQFGSSRVLASCPCKAACKSSCNSSCSGDCKGYCNGCGGACSNNCSGCKGSCKGDCKTHCTGIRFIFIQYTDTE